MKKIFAIMLLISPLSVFCQNLTGTWEGSGGGTTYIKMVITQKGDSLMGYTFDEGNGYCKATFLGKYSRSEKRLTGHGVKMLERTPNHVLVDYDLVYSREERGEFLRENIGEEGYLQKLFGSSSRQYLKKISNKTDRPVSIKPQARPAVKNPVGAKPPPAAINNKPAVKPVPRTVTKTPVKIVSKPVVKQPVKPAPVKPRPVAVTKPVVTKQPIRIDTTRILKTPRNPAPAELIHRKDARASTLVETIFTTADTIKMSVYDNGEVDGDTVTVFFDNRILLNRYRISEKARELYLPVSKDGEQHVIELFANNLGSIPPNTALIIIVAGRKRYELHASYDLKTNARIIVQYKE